MASYDVGAGHIVVDTGPWIFGRKVMLPAGVMTSVDTDNRTVTVNRTKDQIKMRWDSMTIGITRRTIGTILVRTTGIVGPAGATAEARLGGLGGRPRVGPREPSSHSSQLAPFPQPQPGLALPVARR